MKAILHFAGFTREVDIPNYLPRYKTPLLLPQIALGVSTMENVPSYIEGVLMEFVLYYIDVNNVAHYEFESANWEALARQNR